MATIKVVGIFFGLLVAGAFIPKVSRNKSSPMSPFSAASSPPSTSPCCWCFRPAPPDPVGVEVDLRPSSPDQATSWVDLLSGPVSCRLPLLTVSPIFHPCHPYAAKSSTIQSFYTTLQLLLSMNSPSPRNRQRAPPFTSNDDYLHNFRSPGMLLLGSVDPLSTDAMRGSSIRLYAPLVPLQDPAGELIIVNSAVVSSVIIRSMDLDVIWSSFEVLSVSLAA
jgi:hypothetical protein